MDRFEHRDLIPVRRCALRHQAEQYALVLAAMGIQASIALDGELLVLSVAYRDAPRATSELAAYDREKHDIPPRKDIPLPTPPRLEVALSFWAILLFFFAAARHEAFSVNWLGKGAAQSGLMLGGEWWRAVTSPVSPCQQRSSAGQSCFWHGVSTTPSPIDRCGGCRAVHDRCRDGGKTF